MTKLKFPAAKSKPLLSVRPRDRHWQLRLHWALPQQSEETQEALPVGVVDDVYGFQAPEAENIFEKVLRFLDAFVLGYLVTLKTFIS